MKKVKDKWVKISQSSVALDEGQRGRGGAGGGGGFSSAHFNQVAAVVKVTLLPPAETI